LARNTVIEEVDVGLGLGAVVVELREPEREGDDHAGLLDRRGVGDAVSDRLDRGHLGEDDCAILRFDARRAGRCNELRGRRSELDDRRGRGCRGERSQEPAGGYGGHTEAFHVHH
jgi:hypothetical protein